MANSAESYPSPRDVLRMLSDHRRRWLTPLLAGGLLAGIYALVSGDTWEASQTLIIREEATVGRERPSGYIDNVEMKTVQETILELSRSKGVLRAALTQVGPEANARNVAAWPSDRDIADLRDCLKMTPPYGSEFGKTEVFYLKVRDGDRGRAVALVEAVCGQLEKSFKALRDAKAHSIIDELVSTQNLADSNLDDATVRLADLEREVGVDLAELRMLYVSTSAYSDLRQKLVEVQNEIRRFESDGHRNEQLLAVLNAAKQDPGRLLASPNSLLESQPALRRLKDGLVDAQLVTAKLQGTMSDEHPLVQNALASEYEISNHLHSELEIAIRGIEIERGLDADRVASLQNQLADDQGRLERLAGLRAQYANLLATVQNRTELLEAARRNVADARAKQATAGRVSLISRIDAPDTGANPVGPTKAAIGLVGMFGGLMLGLGIVVLTANPTISGDRYAAAPVASVQPEQDAASGCHLEPAEAFSFIGTLPELSSAWHTTTDASGRRI